MSNPTNKSILLIGWDEHLCLSLLYCLRKSDYTIHLLTHNKRSICKFSRFIGKVFFYEHYDDLVPGIARVTSQINIDLIMPFDELESLYVSQHLTQIEALATVTPLTPYSIFKEAIDKQGLRRYLQERGLDVMPKSMNLKDATAAGIMEYMEFPILLKPARGYFGQGIYTCENETDLHNYLPIAQATGEDFEVQDFIYGSDVTCNVLCADGAILHYSLQESPPKGIKNYARNDDLQFKEDNEVLEFLKPIMKALKWNGIACLDMRRSAKTNKVYLLEVNGRFWGSVMGSLEKAKVNFPLLMAQYALGETPPPYQKQHLEQLSLHTYLQQFKKGKIQNPGKTKFIPYLKYPIARLMKYIPR